jgi:hypothetical protein
MHGNRAFLAARIVWLCGCEAIGRRWLINRLRHGFVPYGPAVFCRSVTAIPACNPPSMAAPVFIAIDRESS